MCPFIVIRGPMRRSGPPLPQPGNGTFDDVSESSGIGRHKGYTMGIVCSDFDGDGWTDIYEKRRPGKFSLS